MMERGLPDPSSYCEGCGYIACRCARMAAVAERDEDEQDEDEEQGDPYDGEDEEC